MSVAELPPDAIRQLGQTVIDRIGVPKDKWEITAQLEVLGYRDADARSRFGDSDLFETAGRIFDLFHEGKLSFFAEEEDSEPRFRPVLRFLRHYFEGLMFSLPMVLQGCTMLLWGYGLWAALDLDLRTGSAIALGFIASYIVTGGFCWAIVRQGLFYYYQNEGGLARWSALRLWWISVRAACALAIPALLMNFLYGFLPTDMFFVALAYYLALSFFWLNWSLIHLVRRGPWLLGILTLSILLVVAAARVLQWPVIAANMLGLAVANLLAFGVGYDGLRRLAKNGAGKPAVNPPRLTVLVYSTSQVFLYGFLYSVFVFLDRVLAWTSIHGRDDFPPYPFWLSAHYELGMDLALLVVVFLAGIVEYSTHRFSAELVPGQKRVKSESHGPFLDEFRSLLRRQDIALSLCAAAAIGLSVIIVQAMKSLPYPRLQEVLASAATMRVFWVAAVSYAVFMFALQRVLILMSLSRADLATRAMAVAVLVNFIVGFAVSRSVDYTGAVLGLLAGSIVLAILARRHVARVLDQLDYYYYSAY